MKKRIAAIRKVQQDIEVENQSEDSDETQLNTRPSDLRDPSREIPRASTSSVPWDNTRPRDGYLADNDDASLAQHNHYVPSAKTRLQSGKPSFVQVISSRSFKKTLSSRCMYGNLTWRAVGTELFFSEWECGNATAKSTR